MTTLSRRKFLKAGTAGLLGAAGAASIVTLPNAPNRALALQSPIDHTSLHGGNIMAGDVDPNQTNLFDPTAMLTDFDYGRVSTLPNGQTLREYDFFAVDKEIEIAPGVFYPAWAYNGRVPGPTIRAIEGDRIRPIFAASAVVGRPDGDPERRELRHWQERFPEGLVFPAGAAQH